MTTKEISDAANLSAGALALLREDGTPETFVDALEKQELYEDAVNFWAHKLASDAGVKWALACIRELESPEQKARKSASLEAADRWVLAPGDAARVRRAMLAADRAIAGRIAEVTASPGAATVALCAPLNLLASKWLVAWVGDCRVYRFAPGGRALELLTRDDTFRNLGEQPAAGGSLDDPARMVGNGATTGANVALHELACGEHLLLCSDGVHKHLDSAAWLQVLAQPLSLARRCEALIALARSNGSADDATVLLVQRISFKLPRPAWLTRRSGPSDSADMPRSAP